MFGKPSLVTCIAVGKALGLLFGLAGFLTIPYLLPGSPEMLRWGFLLWYVTVGAFIGVSGVLDRHPALDIPFPWWVRGPLIGGWMNLVLTLLDYDRLSAFGAALFGAGSPLASPFWFVLEGAVVGLVIGYAATSAGGDGPEVVQTGAHARRSKPDV